MLLNYDHVRRHLARRGFHGGGTALIQLDAVIDPCPRNLAIYRAALGDYPELEPVLTAAEEGRIDPRAAGTLQQHADLEPADRAALYAFWHARYHEESWLHHDAPFTGAPEFLRQLVHDGYSLVYLSGRDGPTMGQGTRTWMLRHGLPLQPDATVLFRSGMEIPESEFIEHALHDGHEEDIDLVLESKASRANRIHEIIPHALVLLVGHAAESGFGARLYPSIVTCDHYAAATA